MDGAGFWRASIRSDIACVPTSDGESIGNYFCTGKRSVISETRCYALLGMYDIRNL